MHEFLTVLWVFAHNLRIPFLIVGLGVMALCAAVGLHGMRVRERSRYGEAENTDARWRQNAAVQGGILMLILSAVIWAIPAPDYDVRYVEKRLPPIVQKVQVPVYRGIRIERRAPHYVEFYNTCVASITGGHTDDELKQCHDQSLAALAASGPRPAVVTRVRIKHDPYQELFAQCNDFQISSKNDNPAAIRNERLKICHQVALDGSRDR